MAKIPTMGNTGRVRAVGDRPADASAAAEVSVARQIQNLGRSVGAIGQELMEKRSQAEAAEYGDNSKRNYRREINQYKLEAKSRFKDDPKGYAKDVNDFATEKRNEYIENAPSERARKYFEGKSSGLFETTLIDSDTYENVEIAKKYIKNRQEGILTVSNELYDNPQIDVAVTDLNEFIDEINNQQDVQYTGDQAKAMNDGARDMYRQGLVEGLINKGRLQDAKSLLKGDMEGTEELLATMTPKEKARYLNKIEAKRESMSVRNDKISKTLVKNAIEKLQDAEVKTPAEMQSILQAREMIGSIQDPADREIYKRSFESAIQMNQSAQQMHVSQGEKVMDMFYNPDKYIKSQGLLGYKSEAEAKKNLRSLAEKVINLREKDGAEYVQKYHPEAATDPRKMYEMQKALGIKNARVVNKDQTKVVANALVNAPDEHTRLQIFNEYLDEYGDMSKEALDDLVKDKVLPSSIVVAAGASDEKLKSSFLDSLSRPGVHREEFKNNPDFKAEKTEIPGLIRDKAGDFLDASTDIMDPESRNHFHELIEIEAMKNRKKVDSIDKAVEKAVDDVVNKHYTVMTYDNGWWGRNRTAIMPAGVNKNVVESFLEKSLDNLDAKDLDIDVKMNGWVDAPEYETSTSTLQGTSYTRKVKDPKKKFFQQIAERGEWVPNKTHTGMMLRYVDITGRVGFIRDSKGNIVEKNFDEMQYLSFVREDLD